MAVETKKKLLEDKSKENGVKAKQENGNSNGADEATDRIKNGDDRPPLEYGYPRAAGHWASCIQVIDPVTEKAVIYTVELRENKTALSAALVCFESRENDYFLAIGVAQDMTFMPFGCKSASIQLYKVSADGRSLEFFHETEMSEPPLALLGFKGKLVAGVGRDLALYDCGMRSLLRKAQTIQCVTTRIVDLKTQGSRLIVSDQIESVTFVVHKDMVHPSRLIAFADDSVSRHTTCTEMVDYDTVVGGDRFGNLWLLRCPPKVSETSDESNDGQHLIQDKSYLGGAPNRLDTIANYFANDIPVSLQKTALLAGGERVIFWAGLQGTLGALVPFQSRRDFKMFQQLELELRKDDQPISGRDHLAFRSYYNPVKSFIDGDLIERFLVMGRDARESIIGSLTGNWTSESVDEAIWNMRGLYAF